MPAGTPREPVYSSVSGVAALGAAFAGDPPGARVPSLSHVPKLSRRAAAWLGWSVLGLVLVIAAVLGGLYLYLRTSLPKLDGALMVAGLDGPVTIQRDANGIPHIFATDAHDAFFAIGFVHGQDRRFQMDVLRRYGAGELAAIAGKDLVQRDRLMRTLGLAQAAKEQYQHLDQRTRRLLQAYADGVNAAVATHRGARVPYFYFAPKPPPWTPVDSLLVRNVMALYLSQNYRGELLHARLAERLSPARLHQLYPGYPQSGLVTLASLVPLYRKLPLERLARLMPPESAWRYASNSWVVDGAHTATGKPMLENDPHLTLTAPSVWYLLRANFPGYALEGGTIPGAPFLIVGDNGHVGWGMTEAGADVEDLFIEKTDPKDPGRYLTPTGSAPFMTRSEVIHVHGGHDVRITIRSTRHGPVISDVLGAGKGIVKPGYVLALDATWLEPDDKTLQALCEMGFARNWQQFRDALEDFAAPQMNITFASTDGTIAFMAPGRIPVRKSGHGWVPHPGWTGQYDWTGFIPFDSLPQGVDPPKGRFVSANNKDVSDIYPYFLTDNWAPPYRADRIEQLLDATPEQTLDSMARIAGDTYSGAAHDLLPLMLRVKPETARDAWAVRQLRDWNDMMSSRGAAPLLFMAWLRQLNRALFAKPLGPAFGAYWTSNPLAVKGILTSGHTWCVPSSGVKGDCGRVLAESLHEAVRQIERRLGGEPRNWRWGALHQARFENPVLSRVPLIGEFGTPTVPAGGADNSIDAGITRFSDRRHPFRDIGGPSLRFILDFADLSRSRFMVAPGVSGNPLSSRYSSLVRPWRAVQWIGLSSSRPAHTLHLLPRPHLIVVPSRAVPRGRWPGRPMLQKTSLSRAAHRPLPGT